MQTRYVTDGRLPSKYSSFFTNVTMAPQPYGVQHGGRSTVHTRHPLWGSCLICGKLKFLPGGWGAVATVSSAPYIVLLDAAQGHSDHLKSWLA